MAFVRKGTLFHLAVILQCVISIVHSLIPQTPLSSGCVSGMRDAEIEVMTGKGTSQGVSWKVEVACDNSDDEKHT